MDRQVLEPGELACPVVPEQVGPPCGTHQEAPAGEHRHDLPFHQDDVAHVLRRVAGRMQRPDRHRAAGEILLVESRKVVEGYARGRRQHEPGTGTAGEVAPARHVVVVDMGLEDMGEMDARIEDGSLEPLHVPLRVDDHSAAVVGQQVGTVPQSVGPKRRDPHIPPGSARA